MLNFFLFHITQLDLNHYVSQAVLELQILLPLPPSHVIILYRCHMPSYLLCHSLSVYMCMYVICVCVSVCVRVCEGVWWWCVYVYIYLCGVCVVCMYVHVYAVCVYMCV